MSDTPTNPTIRSLEDLIERVRQEAEQARADASASLARSLFGMADSLASALGALTALLSDGVLPDEEALEAGRQALLAWQAARGTVEPLLTVLASVEG